MSSYCKPTNHYVPFIERVCKIQKSSQSSSLFTVSRNEHKLGTIVQDRFIPMNYKAGQRFSGFSLFIWAIVYLRSKTNNKKAKL
jgi:hypothetical protein